MSAENKVITTSDGVLYSKDMKELKIYPSLKEDITFTVPDGVISIDSYAMNNLQYLENLHGALKGTALAVWRILRCNPFAKG